MLNSTVNVGGFYDIFLAYVLPIIGIVATAAVGVVAKKVTDWTGIKIEDSYRDSLQTALTNAAGLMIEQLGKDAKGMKIDLKNPIFAAAVRYVQNAAPGALKKFGLGPDAVAEKIKAKLGVLLANV